MKYNVHGFYQPRAVELNLTNDDLLVLRWFVDYSGTGKMRQIIIDNEIFYWVNYNTVLEELPVLQISKQTLYKKHFMNLTKANVLKHKNIKEGGNFSYYCYGLNYKTLIYLEGGCVQNDTLVSKFTEPLCQNLQNPCVNFDTTNNNNIILNNNNNINNNIKENSTINSTTKESKEHTQKGGRFTPPTYEQILEYARERGREDLAKQFYDYFTANDWYDSKGQKVQRWKGKFITWENHTPTKQDNNDTEEQKRQELFKRLGKHL